MNEYDQTRLTSTCQVCNSKKITYWTTELDNKNGSKTYIQYHAGCLKCGKEAASRLVRIIRDI